MPKRVPISEQLRQAILNADMSGLTEAGLSRFVNHVTGLSLESIDKIGECLDLEITPRKPTPTKKGK